MVVEGLGWKIGGRYHGRFIERCVCFQWYSKKKGGKLVNIVWIRVIS